MITDQEAADMKSTRSPPSLVKHQLELHQVKEPELIKSALSGMFGPPVTGVSSQDLGEAVTPEEPTQDDPGVNLAPVERLGHGHHADGHGHPSAVEQAGAQEQRDAPLLGQGSAK